MLIDVARAVLAVGAFVGPLLWLRRISSLAAGWHPLLVLSASTLTVLVAGILGGLGAGVALVLLAGLGLLLHEFLRHRRASWAALAEPAYLVLATTAVLLTVAVHGRAFTHYDNFSHWALVVAVMLEDDALPSVQDAVVRFQTYPLGGASLAYLASRVLGQREWVAMLAHGVFVASCGLPLITLAGRRLLVGTGLYALGVLALLTHITTPTSLLVDSAVAGLGGALLVLILLDGPVARTHPWSVGLIASTLISMKSSGLLFVVIASLALLWLAWRHRGVDRPPGGVVHLLGAMVLPYVIWGLWGRHVKGTFPRSTESKHSVSLDRFDAVLGEKTAQDVKGILSDLATGMLGDWRLWLLVLTVLVVGATAVRGRAITGVEHRRTLTVLLLTIALWEISLALMYLLSMPLGEALNLAGFSRYQGTIHLVVGLVLLALVARGVAPLRRPGQAVTTTGVVAVVVVLSLCTPALIINSGDESTRADIEAALTGVKVADQDKVCVLLAAHDSGYRAWLVRYLLLHKDVMGIVVGDEARALPKSVENECDLILITDHRPHTRDLLRQDGYRLPEDDRATSVVGG